MLSPLWHRWLRRRVQPFQRKRSSLSHRLRLSVESLEVRDLLSGVAAPFYDIFQPQNGAGPMSTTGPTGYTPSQVAQAYGFNQLSFSSNGNTVPANGAGQTIAIVDAYNDPTIATDLQAFDKQFNLPNPNLSVLNQNGGPTLPGNDTSGWALEESLDVEWAHAMAPGANIILLEANSASYSDLLTAVQTAANLPSVAAVSMSWGGGEWSGETGYDSYFTTPAGHSGVVFIASSGDSGAPPSYPAASPNVLAVGGTTLNLANNAGNYGSESAWSGSGGGISSVEKLPSYQPGTYSNGSNSGTSTMRMNPDVAYDADPNTGFPVYDSYTYGTSAPWVQVGGTSDAAPQWAALVAITDQGRELGGGSALDGPSQLLPTLYKVSPDFHDITTGTTTGSPNYTAGPGYDLTTGLGTPIANYLVPDLVYGAAPATPTGLSATAVSSSQINLSWNSSTDAHSYTLERSLDDTNWSVLTTVSGTTYSDTGLAASTTYYYRVLASNGFGSSAYSSAVSATTQGDNSSATFLKTDTTTQGNWQGVYGGDGYNVIDNASSYPSYAQVSASGNSNWIWSSSTSDIRALQDAVGSSRIAACWYSGSSFTVNVDITDGKTHELALYLLDWDSGGARSEQVQITDATTGKVLSTENASNYQNGDYLVWNVSGNININITRLGGPNAVLSGLFFGGVGSPPPPPPPPGGSASFVKTDTTTQGNWHNVYGSQGYNVIENAVNYPSYAQVSASGNSNWIWSSSTSDIRALQDAVGSSRIAACWYSGGSFTVNVDITDGKTHQLALYLLDWDSGGARAEQIQITDATTGNFLSTENASNYQNGEYLVWNVGGDINIRFTNTGGPNAVLSGMFFDAVA